MVSMQAFGWIVGLAEFRRHPDMNLAHRRI